MAIIYSYPKKSNPTSRDLVLITDHEDNKTKNATISSIQELVNGVSSVNGLAGVLTLDTESNVANNNLAVTTNTNQKKVTYKLANHLNEITTFEEGDFEPKLEYYDKASTTWVEWDKNPDGTDNDDRTYDTDDNFSGKYTRINKGVILRFRCYVNNAGAPFDVGGLRINMPYSFFSGNALTVSFTQSLGLAAQNATSLSRTWISGNKCYLMQENVSAGSDTAVFPTAATGTSPTPVPQVYFSSYGASVTYRLRTGSTNFNAGGACRIN